MKFKVKETVTVDGLEDNSLEFTEDPMYTSEKSPTYETFIEEQIVELMVNNINQDGCSFDAIYKRGNGKAVYLFNLSEKHFEKID